MTEAAVIPEVTTITPRRKVNGAAGPVVAKTKPADRFTIADSIGKDKTAVLNLEGGALKVVYNARRISLEEQLEIAELIASEEPERRKVAWITEWLSRIIVSWELYANPSDPEDMTLYPTTAAALLKLNRDFLGEVAEGIQADIDPPAPATDSGSFA